MIADISQVELHSLFFAKLVKAYSPVEELRDGVVYVKTNNESSWNTAVSKAKVSFADSSMRGSWLIKYDIDFLPEELYPDKESAIRNLMGTESNIIMPIFLPDRMEQYYFVGSISDVKHVEQAAATLSVDAQNLIISCFPYAISVMEESSLKSVTQGIYDKKITDEWADEWADEVKRLNANRPVSPSFRGMVSANPLAMFGDDAVKSARAIKKGLVPYKKRRELIKNLPIVGKKLRSEDSELQKKGKIEYAQAIEALDEHEKVLLLHALIKEVKPKALKNILAGIADRETLGVQTKYNIVFKSFNNQFKEFGYDDNYKNCLFIADGETLYPLRMNKSSLVIYTMTLVEKVTKNKKYAIVDVEANNKAFNEIYRLLFHDFNETDTQRRFEELIKRNKYKPDMPIRTGRLSENYSDIEASLQKVFKNLDEDYSPFLANSTTPLAINADKIILSPELMAVKIR